MEDLDHQDSVVTEENLGNVESLDKQAQLVFQESQGQVDPQVDLGS